MQKTTRYTKIKGVADAETQGFLRALFKGKKSIQRIQVKGAHLHLLDMSDKNWIIGKLKEGIVPADGTAWDPEYSIKITGGGLCLEDAKGFKLKTIKNWEELSSTEMEGVHEGLYRLKPNHWGVLLTVKYIPA